MRVICTIFASALFWGISSAAQPVPVSPPEAETTSVLSLDQAPKGGIEFLSDTEGVDFSSWMKSWPKMTQQAWNPQFVAAANAPKSKSGIVAIRFKVLPNGRLMDGSMILERRSGDVAMDRAAWVALTSLSYPPLPSAFHGPYLELRAYLPYDTQPGH